MQTAQYADLKVYLPNDPLVKVDRMSMAHGLEIRCPLLDHRIVELAFRIPTSMKLANGEPKSLLEGLGGTAPPFRLGAQAQNRFYCASWRVVVGPVCRAIPRTTCCRRMSRDIVDSTRQAAIHRAFEWPDHVRVMGGVDAGALGSPGPGRTANQMLRTIFVAC